MHTTEEEPVATDLLRVLVVEDELFLNKVICQFIAFKRSQPLEALTLALARQRIQDESPDLILLDQHLPDGDGLDLVAELAEQGVGIPVIMMSGDDDQALMVSAFEAGVEDFLIKPVNFELAWLKIQRLLRKRALENRVQEQQRSLHRLLYEKHLEEQMALHLYQHVMKSVDHSVDAVEWIILPNAKFSGDLVLSRFSPAGNLYILVADATGHGLAAALSVMPLATAFKAMVNKGIDLSNMVFTLNQQMLVHTPDDRFVACVLVEINLASNELLIWNGGMPEVLLLNQHGVIDQPFPSAHMALGILDDALFDARPAGCVLPDHGSLVISSDGLMEQENAQGEQFGRQRWYDFISTSPQPVLEKVRQTLFAFSGQRKVADDVTLCRVDLQALRTTPSTDSHVPNQANAVAGDVQWRLHLVGAQLARHDVLDNVNVFLKNAGFERSLCQRAFSVIAELYNNALDHGVLGLDSAVKDQEDGFLLFLDARQQRMASLTDQDFISLTIESQQSSPVVLQINILDSGKGYDQEEVMARVARSGSGRGLAVLRNLCESWVCHKPGNQTTAIVK